MADNQVRSLNLCVARTIIPEARNSISEQQKAVGEENSIRCEILQECWTRIPNSQRSHREQLRGQEVPIHQRSIHPRENPQGNRHLHQNAANHCGTSRLSPLRSQVQPIREASQEYPRALLPCFHRQGR